MDDVIIHIGYPKSASTFLQTKIFPNLPLHYLMLVGPNRKYLDMVVSKTALDINELQNWINAEVKKQRANNTYQILLLSHEELAGIPNNNNPEIAYATAQNLKRLFPNAKILIIIRNQIDYLLSLYAFRVGVKGAETKNFNQFIQRMGKSGLFEYLQYHRLIQKYQDLFGASQVLVFPMEMLKKDPDTMLKEMFAFMGVSPQPISPSSSVNVSAKNLAVLFIFRCINWAFNLFHSLVMFFTPRKLKVKVSFTLRYYFNRFKRSSAPILSRFFYFAPSLDSKNLTLEEKTLALIKESNMWIQKNLQINLSALNYPMNDDIT